MQLSAITTLPYCGAPPSPNSLAYRWNLDPVLILLLITALVAYIVLARRVATLSFGQQFMFYCGWFVSSAALLSPLCPLSVSLFSARVGQHMVLVLIGAPLIAAGCPRAAFRDAAHSAWKLGGTWHAQPSRAATLPASIVFAALLWFWHTPLFYDATFTSSSIYWTMHITLFGSALYLWLQLLDPESTNALRTSCASTFASIQMGLLGAIITFAPRALYAPHQFTTISWGLSPLQDQQLGGVIMWVPGCVSFLLVAMYSLARVMAPTWRISWSLPERAK